MEKVVAHLFAGSRESELVSRGREGIRRERDWLSKSKHPFLRVKRGTCDV